MASEGTNIVSSTASGRVSGNFSGSLSGRYAVALYGHAADLRALDAVVAEMDALGRLIDASADLRRLLESPLFDLTHSRRAVLAVLDAQGFGKIVHDFVGVVATNRRLAALRGIIRSFAALVAEKRGVITAEIRSTQPLSDTQREQLRARLIEAGYARVNIEEQVDPTLLGGLVVKIGARLYDTSLKSRIQRLQYAMKGAA